MKTEEVYDQRMQEVQQGIQDGNHSDVREWRTLRIRD